MCYTNAFLTFEKKKLSLLNTMSVTVNEHQTSVNNLVNPIGGNKSAKDSAAVEPDDETLQTEFKRKVEIEFERFFRLHCVEKNRYGKDNSGNRIVISRVFYIEKCLDDGCDDYCLFCMDKVVCCKKHQVDLGKTMFAEAVKDIKAGKGIPTWLIKSDM